ncbi:MAG: hypothetical protein AW08_02610 [Candidatus Accumulibacter adjunctus]|uniref:Uncharacterized protein n=1 Tax=Candidatus Accumulibacter adjunctus TaxID=1454001 RepID=A0A011MVA8_9PROT|nr:MAG: hypothetical protein AW08_02610 [Candidatus Accumulibacter adjunctus]
MEDALLEAALLLLVADREPVLDQDDAAAYQHSFELRAGTEELAVFLLGAEAHDALDTSPVVPAAIEENHLATGGKVLHVTLEIPRCRLALGRRRQRGDAGDARAQAFGDALDAAPLARGITTFEDHHHLELLELDPLLQLDEFDLQLGQRLLIGLGVHLRFAHRYDLAQADRRRRCGSRRAGRFRIRALLTLRLCRPGLRLLLCTLGSTCRSLGRGLGRSGLNCGHHNFVTGALARHGTRGPGHGFIVGRFQFTH